MREFFGSSSAVCSPLSYEYGAAKSRLARTVRHILCENRGAGKEKSLDEAVIQQMINFITLNSLLAMFSHAKVTVRGAVLTSGIGEMIAATPWRLLPSSYNGSTIYRLWW
jgi:hypothetical protein